MSLAVYLPLQFWKSLSRIGVSSSLNFGYNSPVKLPGPGLLFVGRFFIRVSIFMLVMSLKTEIFLTALTCSY